MKKLVLLVVFVLMTTPVMISSIFAQGVDLDCGSRNGNSDQAAEFLMDFSPGTYTITAVGLNGFDPLLGAVNDEGLVIACSDDSADASEYRAELPTSGIVESSAFSAQITLENNGRRTETYALIVGAVGANRTGEFLLMVQGQSIDDSEGDAYSMHVQPNLVASGVPVTIYVFGGDSGLDPVVTLVDSNREVILDDGSEVACDDAGSRCWLDGESLTPSELTLGDTDVQGATSDAYLYVDWEMLGVEVETAEGYLNWTVRGFGGTSEGDYVIVFHAGLGDPENPQSVGAIESQELACTDAAASLTGDPVTVIRVTCPSTCGKATIWGTDIYTDDSPICVAAVHAGVITFDGGTFDVTILDGQESYSSSTQNGITSSTWGAWARSYSVAPAGR